jgi:hypothetical protein
MGSRIRVGLLAMIVDVLDTQDTVTILDDVIEAFFTDATDADPMGHSRRYISVDRCVLVTSKKPQITYGPQKRGKKGKIRRW